MKNFLYLVLLFLLLGTGPIATALPRLNSYPSAIAVIFLDFDGHTVNNSVWNNGNSIECSPSLFGDDQITEIFNRVAEDYRPFNLNITTDSAVFLAAPLKRRMRVIVTPTNYWRPGAGGIAWVSSFTAGDDTPCFVFSSPFGTDQPKGVAEVVSHETGHTLGLQHQASYDNNCILITNYHPGTGSGETSWAPIMGNSRTRNLSLWNFGPTQSSCYSKQDNLYFIITLNGFGYRDDDHSNELTSATTVALEVQQFNVTGIISTIFDNDIFRFDFTETGNLVLNASPFSVNGGNEGANLDMKLSLLDDSGILLRIYDPDSVLHVQVDTILQPGIYYISADGTGNLNTNNDYGSLGSYDIRGYFSVTGSLLAIRKVQLSGYIDKYNHQLMWAVDTDEQIRETAIEWSHDGKDFNTLHVTVNPIKQFTNSPSREGNHYYRIRVTSETGVTKYSNIIKLAQNAGIKRKYVVRTIFPDDLMIIAENEYKYQLFDYNGKLIKAGNGSAGTKRLNMSTLAQGIYLVRLHGPDGSETMRIIKQ